MRGNLIRITQGPVRPHLEQHMSQTEAGHLILHLLIKIVPRDSGGPLFHVDWKGTERGPRSDTEEARFPPPPAPWDRPHCDVPLTLFAVFTPADLEAPTACPSNAVSEALDGVCLSQLFESKSLSPMLLLSWVFKCWISDRTFCRQPIHLATYSQQCSPLNAAL